MPSIIAGSRAKLTVTFTRDRVAFDPQVVLFTSAFTPSTVGMPQVKQVYTYGSDAQVVRTGVGSYYVEQLLSTPGSIHYTWRSTAWGEEVNVEEICAVNARAVLE